MPGSGYRFSESGSEKMAITYGIAFLFQCHQNLTAVKKALRGSALVSTRIWIWIQLFISKRIRIQGAPDPGQPNQV